MDRVQVAHHIPKLHLIQKLAFLKHVAKTKSYLKMEAAKTASGLLGERETEEIVDHILVEIEKE
jgi:hypothetical protein